MRNLRIGAVASIQEKSVAPHLELTVNVPGQPRLWMHAAFLGQRKTVLAARHVRHQKIVVSVAIDVCNISSHGEIAGGTQRRMVLGAKMPVTIVDPTAIRRKRIVANVNVRITIAVEVAKQHRQSLIPRSLRERLSVFVKECSIGP